jgi:hypothetical protein
MWWVSVGYAADCPAPVSAEAWRRHLDAAEVGYRALDPAAFDDAVDGASLDLPCVDQWLAPSDVARWHGLLLLRHYTAGRSREAAQSLAAATAAIPGWALSTELVPGGHELRAMVPAPDGPPETAPRPLAASTWFDGHLTSDRPTARPTLLQLRQGDGRVSLSAYLLPSDPLPPWPVAPAPSPAPLPVAPAQVPVPSVTSPAPLSPAPLPPPRKRPRPPAVAALAVAAVTGGVSGGLALASVAAEDRFWSPVPETEAWTWQELSGDRVRVNALTVSAAAFGAAAAVSGTVAVVTW